MKWMLTSTTNEIIEFQIISLNFAYLINISFLYSGMVIKFLNSLVVSSLIAQVAVLACYLAKAVILPYLQNIFGTLTKTMSSDIASYYCYKMLINLSSMCLLSMEYHFLVLVWWFVCFYIIKEKISIECAMQVSVFPVQPFLLNCEQLGCFKRRVAWSVTLTASSSLVYCF